MRSGNPNRGKDMGKKKTGTKGNRNQKRTEQAQAVPCKFCGKPVPDKTAHRHLDGWVGECCWDERLRASE